MRYHHGPLAGGDQALELAVAHALVRRASGGDLDEVIRVYRPSAPVAVFGRREVRLDGFPAAVRAARAAGFEPAVRATGGRAVAYTGQALVVDHVARDLDAAGGLDHRFDGFGRRLAQAFRGLGVDARVGAVPGEYCPGAHSVNARGTVKLVGTAQRVVKDAWLFSSLVVVGDESRIRPLLTDVYGHLGEEFDGASVGSLSAEVPALDLDTVEAAIRALYGLGDLVPAPLDDATLDLADELVTRHRADDVGSATRT